MGPPLWFCSETPSVRLYNNSQRKKKRKKKKERNPNGVEFTTSDDLRDPELMSDGHRHDQRFGFVRRTRRVVCVYNNVCECVCVPSVYIYM